MRMSVTDLEKHLGAASSYNDTAKNAARTAIKNALRDAYLEADESAALQRVLERLTDENVDLKLRVRALERELAACAKQQPTYPYVNIPNTPGWMPQFPHDTPGMQNDLTGNVQTQ